MKSGRPGAVFLALLLPSCYDFHRVGPEDPPALQAPATVTIQVVYNQPAACPNRSLACDGPVTFQASWMNPGSYINLQPGGGHAWSATVPGVPVNWPGPEPYRVYAVDPFLRETPTSGVSADRLVVGGERIVKFDNPGNPREQGLIYIDASGKGRTP